MKMVRMALAIGRFTEIHRLFSSAKEDLDVPTTLIKFAKLVRAHHLDRDMSDEDVPVATETL